MRSIFCTLPSLLLRSLLLVAAIPLCTAGDSSAIETTIEKLPASESAWLQWSPRAEISPAFSVVPDLGRTGGPVLRIASRGSSQFGAWKRKVHQVRPGSFYRFTAWYKADGLQHEARSVAPRLEWQDTSGKQVRPPEYALASETLNGWKKIEIVSQAPEKTASAELQLGFGFAAHGSILWDDVSFERNVTPKDRVVKVATIFHRPRGTKSAAESVEQFCQIALQSASARPDIICMPEGISVVGTDKSYYEVGESIPGPTSERLGAVARQLNSYIVAGIYEKVGSILYNTAILVGRDGKLVGQYRKTHLPREEWEAGITPGDDYPVFDTDFGKVGLIICWDVQFPEPARAMARQGAELLLLPIWGGNETLAKARAIENHAFLVSSSYDMKTFILDPEGKILAQASKDQPLAIAELHLDRKIYQWWLGDMKARTWRERRPDLPID